ncbi:MAG: 2-amino-4-hydroxy-6-hydroxymethyldihydropteridine diphosphokinase [Chromatiales bacterium]|nr:2-amino-4-hydroxy-6-hydroxymethyldihydropteridine diphosphokinase [Chromatiales bacterium]
MLSDHTYVLAYVGLGSNLLSPVRQVRQAIAELAQLTSSRLLAVSPLYRTPPMGPAGQPDYINAVAAIETRLRPLELLDGLKEIEQAHQRTRGPERWGPRTLDLDLLLFGTEEIHNERLTVPHAGIRERRFVLQPLLDIDALLRLPDGVPVERLLAMLPEETLLPLEEETVSE